MNPTRTIINQVDINVEDLLPHRGRMKLIDEIVEVDEEKAVTRSRVTDQWPFFDGRAVKALVLIELVAQTAGISNSWEGIKKHGSSFERRGWIVGIKESRFFVETLSLNTLIITRTENQFKFENYSEALGTVKTKSNLIGEVRLQLFQSDSD